MNASALLARNLRGFTPAEPMMLRERDSMAVAGVVGMKCASGQHREASSSPALHDFGAATISGDMAAEATTLVVKKMLGMISVGLTHVLPKSICGAASWRRLRQHRHWKKLGKKPSQAQKLA